jgi:hypothetical protein
MRNSDCVPGQAAFNWMAVQETPGVNQSPVTVRMAVLPPQFFSKSCTDGDTPEDTPIKFWQAFGGTPTVFLTAGNLFVNGMVTVSSGKGGTRTFGAHNAAVVGVALNEQSNGFTLHARNSDCSKDVSACGFSYAAVIVSPAGGGGGNDNLFVDTGEVTAQAFNISCVDGDTQTQTVFFTRPFLTPPIVLLTANDVGAAGHLAFPVGLAQNVTPYGFTLTGRNSDCAPGMAGFYWVALGCGQGCG